MSAVSTTTFDERALAIPAEGAPLRRPAARRRPRALRGACPFPPRRPRSGGTRTSRASSSTSCRHAGRQRRDTSTTCPGTCSRPPATSASAPACRSSTTRHGHDDRAPRPGDRAGVRFGDLDAAAADASELVEPHLHTLVPTDRTKFTALHGAFRTGGTFLYVPPDAHVELPIQALTYLDADGAAVFPHTLLIVEAGSEVTFIDRYVVARTSAGRSRDAIAEIVRRRRRPRALRLDPGVGERRDAPRVQRATVGRDATLRTLNIGFGASLARAEAETILAEPGGFSEMLGVFFARRGPALRPPFDPGPRRSRTARATCSTRARSATTPAPSTAGGSTCVPTRRRRTRCRPRATSSCRSTRRPMRSRTSRSRRTTSAAATRRASVPSTRTRSST